MIPSPRVVAVGDQRVGVYEYGEPTGAPVLTFHGVPACGAGFDWSDAPAKERGLRVIAPDRPGVGLSSPQKDWTVGSYPAMVAALADTLRLDRFAVWGYSGGGPYAVATAARLGDRVTRTAVCAGMGEVGGWASVDDFESTDRQFLKLSADHPLIARIAMGVTGRLARLSPGTAYKTMAKQISASDREVIEGIGGAKENMALFTEAFSRGARGVIDDYRAIGQPWRIDFDAITSPMRVFQGTDDTMVPERHAHELVRRVPGADVVTWPGEGHLGTVRHVAEILDWLAARPES